MLTVLTGDNAFQLQAELHRRVATFVDTYTDMGLERLDGEESSYDRMREALESLPFLAPKKLVVLQRPSSNKEFLEKASDVLANVSDSIDVLIIEPKPDKRTVYYKFLKKHAEVLDFTELDEAGTARWLVERAGEQGGSVSTTDARYLVGRVGVNQQLLSSELAKLITYSPQVTRQTIDLLTDLTPQSTIFELLEAALAGRTKQALQLYQEQRAMKVEPQQIIALLGWQLHVLALVSVAGQRDAATIAKEARVNPYVVRKTQGLARRLRPAQVKKLIHQVSLLDVRMKSEPLDSDEALQHLILTL